MFRIALMLLFLSYLGCSGVDSSEELVQEEPMANQKTSELREKVGNAMTISLTSPAFKEGERIPKTFTGEGEDRSPPIVWSDVPAGTKSFVLICDDPDAPTPQPWVHWVIYAIPPDVDSLPEGVPADTRLETPNGAMQGKNSWDSGQNIGYRGPMPPPGHGTHHYHFTLYALSETPDFQPEMTKTEVLSAISEKVLGEGKLIGTYSRSGAFRTL